MAFRPGWLGRRSSVQPAAAVPGFDAIITLGPYNLPPGVAAARAVIAVRQAVIAMPGAGWISVEPHPLGSGERWVELFPMEDGGDLPAMLAQVQAVAARAIDGLPPAVATIPPKAGQPLPAVPGFAEQPTTFIDGTLPGFSPHQPDAAGPLQAASDAELLADLLGRVMLDGAEVAARRVVERFGSFATVLAMPPAELLAVPGLGPHSVAAIKLVHEAAVRLSRAGIMHQPVLASFDLLIRYLTVVLAREAVEHVRILFLDADGRIRADEAQARGTVDHTPVYPREVAPRALELGATALILVHNHPSGDPTPSREDAEMTRMVFDACAVVGLQVRDHVIVGNGRWFSFRQEGLLPD